VSKVAREHPVVLLGDLNATPDAETVGLLRKAGFIDAYAAVNSAPRPTWDELLNTNIKLQYFSKPGQENAPRERKRIDFIFVRGG
jgi:endonuclease/exonuclease/phosphatase family metal-dependent hydrolase